MWQGSAGDRRPYADHPLVMVKDSLGHVDMKSTEVYVQADLDMKRKAPVDSGKQARAMECLAALWVAGAGCLSWQVLHEFYWNAVRKMRLEPARAREIVEDLAHWTPVDTTLGLVQQAWHWTDAAQLSYWDALILAAPSVPAPGTCCGRISSPTDATTACKFSTRSTTPHPTLPFSFRSTLEASWQSHQAVTTAWRPQGSMITLD